MGKAVSAVMYCSFCGRESRQVEKLISGHTVYICSDCVTKCVAIVEDQPDRDTLPLRDREDYSDGRIARPDPARCGHDGQRRGRPTCSRGRASAARSCVVPDRRGAGRHTAVSLGTLHSRLALASRRSEGDSQ